MSYTSKALEDFSLHCDKNQINVPEDKYQSLKSYRWKLLLFNIR